MDEFRLIADYFAPLARKEKGALGLNDDAALLQVPAGQELVITKDAIIAGVHFTGDESPDSIAQKLLRVNLSDLAAMGAKPYGYFLALMLPARTSEAWVKTFAEGLRADQERYGIMLMGGDTTRTPGPLSLSLTALGLVPSGKALLRSGAHSGDSIYVTGTLGDAALGLRVARGELTVNAQADSYLLGRYQLPLPRVAIGQELRGIATSCMDISDGLLQDLGHICNASKTGAIVHWPDISLSDAARMAIALLGNPYDSILAGGDDYELLFTAPEEAKAELMALSEKTGVAITAIGSMNEKGPVRMLDRDGKDIGLTKKGYRHF